MGRILSVKQRAEVLDYIRANPGVKGKDVMARFDISDNTAYRYIKEVKAEVVSDDQILEAIGDDPRPVDTSKAFPRWESPRKIDEQKALVESAAPPTPLDTLVNLLKEEHHTIKQISDLEGRVAELQERQIPAAKHRLALVQERIRTHFVVNTSLVAGLEAVKRRGVEALAADKDKAGEDRRLAEWRHMEQEAARDK